MTALYHRVFPSLPPPPNPKIKLSYCFITYLRLRYILMISSHTKNIVVKKREREKTVNTGAEYQTAAKRFQE